MKHNGHKGPWEGLSVPALIPNYWSGLILLLKMAHLGNFIDI